MIRYLVKFVAKEAYADDLLNGKLYMHCAKYYHDLEKKYGPGQGDIREGAIFPNVAIYRGIYYPIYCMYMIKDEDIIDSQVEIAKKVIDDFNCQNGFMVLIPFAPFERVLQTADTGGFRLCGTEVWYGYPTNDDIEKLFNSNNALSLKIKNPHFHYQREYRLIVYKDLYEDGFTKSLKEEKPFICHLREPIADIAKKIPISNLEKTDTGYVLNFKGFSERM